MVVAAGRSGEAVGKARSLRIMRGERLGTRSLVTACARSAFGERKRTEVKDATEEINECRDPPKARPSALKCRPEERQHSGPNFRTLASRGIRVVDRWADESEGGKDTRAVRSARLSVQGAWTLQTSDQTSTETHHRSLSVLPPGQAWSTAHSALSVCQDTIQCVLPFNEEWDLPSSTTRRAHGSD
jgi:hypothetical protein